MFELSKNIHLVTLSLLRRKLVFHKVTRRNATHKLLLTVQTGLAKTTYCCNLLTNPHILAYYTALHKSRKYSGYGALTPTLCVFAYLLNSVKCHVRMNIDMCLLLSL
jgi:hypothetical protein